MPQTSEGQGEYWTIDWRRLVSLGYEVERSGIPHFTQIKSRDERTFPWIFH
jgi:hypothetical protein